MIEERVELSDKLEDKGVGCARHPEDSNPIIHFFDGSTGGYKRFNGLSEFGGIEEVPVNENEFLSMMGFSSQAIRSLKENTNYIFDGSIGTYVRAIGMDFFGAVREELANTPRYFSSEIAYE